jgi:DNA (cytosine-5)-methyltransferase 1
MMKIGSLCSGIDGLSLGIERALGAHTVWQSEIDSHASAVLAARWPDVPNLGDLRAVDWAAVEPVDIMCFGFPCQDISSAGRRAGLEGDKSGLWFDCADAVRVVRPRYVLVENVSALLVRGFGRVLADLAEMGYVGRWGCLRSSDIGAPHRRERIFLAATDARSPGTRRHPGTAPGTQEPDRRRQPHDGHASVARRAAPTDADSPPRSTGDAECGDCPSAPVRGGTAGPGGRGSALTDAPDERLKGAGAARSWGTGPTHRGHKPPRRPHADGRGHLVADTDIGRDWGMYTAAVRRWEALHGPAPRPRDDRGRLNPALPEWMLGYPAGWVTDPAIGLPRTAQLRVLGNAVQPQVAELATQQLLAALL